jgi:phage terminase large subunit-like protein
VVCGAEHLWQVTKPAHRWPVRHSHGVVEANPNYRRQSIVKASEIIAAYESRTPTAKQRFAFPHVGQVEFPAAPVTIEPYLLGLLLGDGCLRRGVALSTADAPILKHFTEHAKAEGLVVQHRGRYDYAAVNRGGKANAGQANPLLDKVRQLGLYGALSHEKFIPDEYLLNSVGVRLAVLQGLMDTDGSADKNGTIEFSSSSWRLAEGVAFLVRSFGGKVRIDTRTTRYTYKGEKRDGRVSYRLWIRLPQVAPFRLQRKLDNLVRPTSTCDEHILHRVERVEDAPAVCISVAHPSALYVTRDFIVTHNTWSAAYETAMHATGRYPEWWRGAEFDGPTNGWASGVTSESMRDTVQRLLLGRPGQWGTGTIPKADIIDIKRASHGVLDAVDTVLIKHVSGGTSTLSFKAYEKGREKWQGETLDYVWFDEEPPADIYSEGLTRTNATRGIAYITFTPLLGMSDVVKRFLIDKVPGTHITRMTIEDAEHYTPAERAAIVAGYPAHERAARARGEPILGSGRVFPVDESVIKVKRFAIPRYLARIAGIDFGWTHPTAVVWLAWDRDNDSVHIYDAYRRSEATPLIHAATIKSRGDWIPVAWPHDGEGQDGKGGGDPLAQKYRALGVNMLKRHATHPPKKGQEEGTGGNSVEAGVLEMLDMMETGRLTVAEHLHDWFEEFRLYHRKDGVIVKINDDIMSATRYAIMMRRHAKVRAVEQEPRISGFQPADAGAGY